MLVGSAGSSRKRGVGVAPLFHGEEPSGPPSGWVIWYERDSEAEVKRALAVRDGFLEIASHELLTPITSMKLQLQGVMRALSRGGTDSLPDHRMHRALSVVNRQTGRLSDIVEELFDASTLAKGRLPLRPERFDLTSLVLEVVERYTEQLHQAGCTLEFEAPEPIFGVWDRRRIDEAVFNLLSNAIKFGAGQPIRVEVTACAEMARLIVQDHGIGIAPEHHGRVFDRFETAADEASVGFGLGLYIARSIVENHGGTIRVQSELGLGSTFTVELPVVQNQQQAATKVS
jgi:signal transduction histidine kinase